MKLKMKIEEQGSKKKFQVEFCRTLQVLLKYCFTSRPTAQRSAHLFTVSFQFSGFTAIESYMFEEHEMLRRAATQTMTNMIVSDDVVKIYEAHKDKVGYLQFSGR